MPGTLDYPPAAGNDKLWRWQAQNELIKSSSRVGLGIFAFMTNPARKTPGPIISDNQEVDLIRLVWTLWLGKWKVALVTFVVTALATAYALLAPPMYSVTSIWLPQQSSQMNGQMGQIAGLAGLMGVSLGQANTIEQYYPQIITSPTILKQIINHKWPTLENDSLTLDQFLKIDTNTFEPQLPNISKHRLMESMLKDYLLGNIVFESSPTSYVLTVQAPDPVMACAINQYILSELQKYVEENRVQSTATDRDFFQQKYEEYKDSLSKAEGRLLYFRLNNRLIISPNQMLEQDRLQTEINTISNLVTEFRKQFEMAQINISKKSSDFRMLQEPEPPSCKRSPKRKLIFAAGIAIGLLFGCCFVLVQAWWRNSRHKIHQTTAG